MFKKLFKFLTKDFTEVSLLWITFDLDKFKNNGAKNSCLVEIHPTLREDKHIENTLRNLVDYIRDSYNMEELSK